MLYVEVYATQSSNNHVLNHECKDHIKRTYDSTVKIFQFFGGKFDNACFDRFYEKFIEMYFINIKILLFFWLDKLINKSDIQTRCWKILYECIFA